MSKYILIPDDVQVRDMVTDEVIKTKKKDEKTGETVEVPQTISFKEFMLGMVLPDAKWGKSSQLLMTMIELRERLMETIKEKKPFLQVGDTEWETLCTVIKEPTLPYNPVVAMNIRPFLRAILDAKSEKPKLEAVPALPEMTEEVAS